MMKTGTVILLAGALVCSGCRRTPTSAAKVTFSITEVAAERSRDHLHLRVTLKVNNQSDEPLVPVLPAVQLKAAGDRPVLFLAGPGPEPEPIPPGTEAATTTHWWLSAVDVNGPLQIEIEGQQAAVKTAGVWSLEQLPENTLTTLEFPEWKPKPPGKT